MIFKATCLALLSILFYTSTPARNVTADALSTAAQIVRP